MMSVTTKRIPHLALSPWCSVCDDSISEGENTLLFVGYDKATTRCTLTKPFAFPPTRISVTETNGFLLCLNPNCRRCSASPECAALHRHCFIGFVQSCLLPTSQVVPRLRTIAFCKMPWAKAPRLYLGSPQPGQLQLGNIAHDSDLVGLRRLPQELLDSIRRLSPHAWLWRFMTVLALSGRATESTQPSHTLVLSSIESWQRGGNVYTSQDPSRSAMRITIDSYGIQSIERVYQQTVSQSMVSRSHAYVVVQAEEQPGIQAHIQDGFLRLRLPPNRRERPLIWDTACPPPLADCYVQRSQRWQRQRLTTINLNAIHGITLFYSMGRIYGVFPHESRNSCALSLYNRFTKRRQQYTVWIYLPISRQDRILVLGSRQNDDDELGIMVRTERLGDSIIGPQCGSGTLDRFLLRSQPSFLVVNEPSDDVPVTLGAYDPNCSAVENQERFVLAQYTRQSLGMTTYFSSAPLAEVQHAHIFEHDELRLCRGIVFEYKNGSSRAVGQCRLGVDCVRTYIEPLAMHWRTSSGEDQFGLVASGVQVEFGRNPDSDHPQDDWKCCVFPKTLQFWFSEQCTMLSVDLHA